MDIAAFLFWSSLAALFYVYAGYPLLVRLLGGLRPRPVLLPGPDAPFTPVVTILIAAFNEARHIAATVANKLALDYPTDRLEVIVISDESEDGTDDLVRAIDDPRVRLIRQSPRAGKTSALNLARPEARGEVIVFSDANSLYAAGALRAVVAHLADPAVGYVTGRMVYKAPDGSLTGQGCSLYMKYENVLRAWETRLGSVVGVDGGIDAMRADLYRPLRPDQLPDFVQPLLVRRQGYRVVYAPDALLYEDALAEASDEFRMRVRVGLRAWHALKDQALGPVFQIIMLVTNLVLAPDSAFWQVVLAGQIAFYLAALAGHLDHRGRLPMLVTAATYFCLINAASGVALIRFLQGRKQVIWQPRT